LVNNLLGAAIGMMAIVLNLGLGIDPVVVGTLMALPRLLDALTDPLMGYISDHAKLRWGRRRPFIFFGALASGLVFALLWQLPSGYSQHFYFWYFLIGANLFYLAYTVYATPWVALGYEMTPDYHERTRLMGVSRERNSCRPPDQFSPGRLADDPGFFPGLPCHHEIPPLSDFMRGHFPGV